MIQAIMIQVINDEEEHEELHQHEKGQLEDSLHHPPHGGGGLQSLLKYIFMREVLV